MRHALVVLCLRLAVPTVLHRACGCIKVDVLAVSSISSVAGAKEVGPRPLEKRV